MYSAAITSDDGDDGTGPAAADDDDDDDDKVDDAVVRKRLRASRADASSDTRCALDCSTIWTLHWKCFERALYLAFTFTQTFITSSIPTALPFLLFLVLKVGYR